MFKGLNCVVPAVQGSDGGMSPAQLQDRKIAIEIAAGACDADTAELVRLTRQTEEIQKWLMK